MHTSHRIWLMVLLASLVVASISTLAGSPIPTPQAPNSADIPVVKGGAGSCSADFVVTDPSGKGIYDAKIRIQIQYRFLALHKLDLTVGTNYEGKARIEGLPEQIKKTAEFKISHGDQSKSLPFDPVDNCHPKLEVVLGEK
jgi:hypothetical protein